MKKIYALLAVVLILSVGVFVVVGFNIDEQKDQVRWKETVVYGDKSITDGITLTTRTQMGYHLFWETTSDIGKELLCDTKYDFSAFEKRDEAERTYRGVEIWSPIQSGGAYYGYGYEKESEQQTGIDLALKELFDETDEGEKKTKIIYLKDYYEYYPLHILIEWDEETYTVVEINSENASSDVLAEKFSQFFKIPVLESDCMSITVSKGEALSNGSVSFSEEIAQTRELYSFASNSAYAASYDKWFFTISNQKGYDDEIEYMDMSLIPGGYGVYAFSYNRALNPPYIDADSLHMAFPLNKEEVVQEILIRDKDTRMLLVTWENDGTYVKVIDVESMTELQKFKIYDKKTYLYYNAIHEYDDFIAIVLDNCIAVLSDENGSYTHEFTVEADLDESELPEELIERFFTLETTSAMDFDGKRLVVTGTIQNRYIYDDCCDFYIKIYDKTGLIYLGQYESSLSANLVDSSYSAYECHPAEVKPFEIEWNP